MYKKSLKIPKC